MSASFAAAYEEAMKRKARVGPAYNKYDSVVSGQSRVGPGFPDMGTIQPSHMGSQSTAPTKQDNYTDTNMDVPPIDRGAYGPGY